MSDLALCRRSDGNFDLDFDSESGDLLLSEGLENAVAISIGTYARNRSLGTSANLEPVLGGWWADALDESGTLGGYLYEAFPGKLTDSTCRDVETLVKDALKWMVSDGVAKSVSCSAEIDSEDAETVSISVTIEKPQGNAETFKFEVNWKATIDGI